MCGFSQRAFLRRLFRSLGSLFSGFGFGSGRFRSRFFGGGGFSGGSRFCGVCDRLRGLHLRTTATPDGWGGRFGRRLFGRRFYLGRFGPATARRRFGRRLRFVSAHAFFTLPPSADTGYLVVGQERQMATNRNVHMAQQNDHLIS